MARTLGLLALLAIVGALGAAAATPPTYPRPPSPPLPVPPPPPPCPSCVYVQLTPPMLDAMKYRFDNKTCQMIQTIIAEQLNAEYAASGRTPMIQNFTVDPIQCKPLEIAVCGIFASTADAQSLAEYADYQSGYWLEVLTGGGGCSAVLDGYRLSVTSKDNQCLYVEKYFSCAPPIDPFPNCKCNKTKMITPFKPSAYGYTERGRSNTTTLYCFIVNLLGPDERTPGVCANADMLFKIEWWADDNLKTRVRGILIRPNVGSARWIAPTWGVKGENNMRATPLNWTFLQANGAKVCVELQNTITLSDLCQGPEPNQCYMSFFNSDMRCCPVYRAEVLV